MDAPYLTLFAIVRVLVDSVHRGIEFYDAWERKVILMY